MPSSHGGISELHTNLAACGTATLQYHTFSTPKLKPGRARDVYVLNIQQICTFAGSVQPRGEASTRDEVEGCTEHRETPMANNDPCCWRPGQQKLCSAKKWCSDVCTSHLLRARQNVDHVEEAAAGQQHHLLRRIMVEKLLSVYVRACAVVSSPLPGFPSRLI